MPSPPDRAIPRILRRQPSEPPLGGHRDPPAGQHPRGANVVSGSRPAAGACGVAAVSRRGGRLGVRARLHDTAPDHREPRPAPLGSCLSQGAQCGPCRRPPRGAGGKSVLGRQPGRGGAVSARLRSAVVAAFLARCRGRERLGDALFAATRHWPVELHFQKGLAGASEETMSAVRGTATNPAVLDAFVLAMIAGGGPPVARSARPPTS
jgi:hypothetical protein